MYKPMRWVILALVSTVTAYSQISAQTGAVTGTVVDPSGAVVSNAKVTIVSARGESWAKTTGDSGDYTFPLLTPGIYRLTVEAKGFNKAAINDVLVQITETTTVPVSLVIGAEAVEVIVMAEQSPINVANPTLGTVLPGDLLDKLPLSVRNFTNLLAFNPATSAAIPDASAANRGSTTIFVSGQRATMNNLVINGVDANNLATNNFATVPVPAPDTIEEFRVQTSLYDASQGKSSGGNINVITRTGGSHYHGQLYEFFRNDKLNANGFFLNQSGTPRPILRQNQFGGNFGGPVPKLGNTFFFGSYEGTRQRNALFNSITGPYPVLPEQRTAENLTAAFGVSRVDPVALALLNQKGQYDGFLVPSGKGAAPGQLGLFGFTAPARFDEDQFNANGDHSFSDRHRLGLRYFQARASNADPVGGNGPGQYGHGTTAPFNNYLASITETWTVSPAAVNEFRLGFNRIESGATANEPVHLSDIGMRRFNESLYPGIPMFNILDSGNIGGASGGNDQLTASNTFHLSDTLAFTKGRHAFRVGFEGRLYQINTFNNSNFRGTVSFSRFTEFLQGSPIARTIVASGETYRDFRARDISWFFQDDWRISRRITLNLGLRYDYFSPSTDRRNRIGNFDPSLLDAATLERGGPGLLRGFVLPENADFGSIQGTPGVSASTMTESNAANFAPRVGLAWDVFGNGRTALRAGYGIYYVRTSNQLLLQAITAAPFFQGSDVPLPNVSLDNPFPNLPLPSQFPLYPVAPELTNFNAQGGPVFSAPLLGGISNFQRNIRTPYAQHYNFSIQQQLPWRLNLELGYVGSQGVRLLQGIYFNQARLANAEAPIRGLTANSRLNTMARTAIPGFSTTGLNTATDNGHSSYNAFILAINRRSGNLYLQGAYTFSKSIDNNSGNALAVSPQDLLSTWGNNLVPLQRAISDFDRRHRLQITYNYDVPGAGNGWMRRLTGNWSLGGTTIFQSGLPINFACLACATANVYGANPNFLQPELIGDFNNIMKSGDPRQFAAVGASVFNPGIVGATPTFTFGQTFGGNLNSLGGPGNQFYTVGSTAGTSHTAQLFGSLPRNPGIRGPFQQQWDLYVARRFPIREGISIVLRGEFFNLWNHAFFHNPNSNLGGLAFGQYTSQANAPRIIQFALKLQF